METARGRKIALIEVCEEKRRREFKLIFTNAQRFTACSSRFTYRQDAMITYWLMICCRFDPVPCPTLSSEETVGGAAQLPRATPLIQNSPPSTSLQTDKNAISSTRSHALSSTRPHCVRREAKARISKAPLGAHLPATSPGRVQLLLAPQLYSVVLLFRLSLKRTLFRFLD